MPREVFLARFSGGLFKDHWALYIPSSSNHENGTLISVEGDVRQGFMQDIRRNYNTQMTRHPPRLVSLGGVDSKHVHNTPASGPLIRNDYTPKDDIEQAAMSIPAPGPSMNPTRGNAPPARRQVFSDCQWWVRQVVQKLETDGILSPGAVAILDNTPKN